MIIQYSNGWIGSVGIGLTLIVWFLCVGRGNEMLIQQCKTRIASIQQKQNDINELLNHQANVKRQSIKLSAQLKSIRWASDESSFIFIILPFIQSSGVSLLSFKPYQNQRVRLLLSGQLSQFQAFFYLLALNQVPLRLGRFYLHHRYDHWEMNAMGVVMLGENRLGELTHYPLATAFPLKWLAYVGWIEQDQTLFALLKLPTERTLAIKVGDTLGIEHWRVSQITPRAIQFQPHSFLILNTLNEHKDKLHVTVDPFI